MELIIKGRNAGKTTALIEKAANYNGYIVCLDESRAIHIITLAEKLGVKINHPLTALQFLGGNYHGPGVKRVFIDNADQLLQQICKVPIEAITLTQPKIKLKIINPNEDEM